MEPGRQSLRWDRPQPLARAELLNHGSGQVGKRPRDVVVDLAGTLASGLLVFAGRRRGIRQRVSAAEVAYRREVPDRLAKSHVRTQLPGLDRKHSGAAVGGNRQREVAPQPAGGKKDAVAQLRDAIVCRQKYLP